ncbi:DUF4097 family beta strand repeat-containing protein [Mycoplasmatota bacterium WC30]
MKKFLKDLETELRNKKLSESEIKEILADHEEMIQSAKNEGLTDEELEAKFGSPKNVAEELSEFTEKEERKSEAENNTGKSVEFTGIKENYNVNIALISEDVKFVHNDDNKIVVTYVGERKFERFEISFSNNELTIKSPKNRFNFGFSYRNSKNQFTISIPKNVKINDFKLKLISGDSILEDIEAESFVLETNSGDATLCSLKLGESKFSTISGNVSLENIVCKDFAISTISGDAKITNLVSKNDILITTVSGDAIIENSNCVEAMLKTVSGDIKGNEFYPKALSLKSVSGDLVLKNLESDKKIEIKRQRTVSGDIKIITK